MKKLFDSLKKFGVENKESFKTIFYVLVAIGLIYKLSIRFPKIVNKITTVFNDNPKQETK